MAASTKIGKPSPKSFLVLPGRFAEEPAPRFNPWDRQDIDKHSLAAAAWFQHQVCFKARVRIKGEFGSVAKFIEFRHVPNATAVHGKLAGDSWFFPEDYLSWAYHLGRGILPRHIPSRDHLYPTHLVSAWHRSDAQ